MPLSDHDPLAEDERIEHLPPRLLRATAECQPRLENRDEVIADYAERMLAGDAFPPVRARFDGSDYYLSNGFHRRAAAVKANVETIPVRVRPGDLLSAIEDSCAANADHGIRREPGDKKRAVLAILAVDRQRGIERGNRAVADHCGVTPQFVGKVRASTKQFQPQKDASTDQSSLPDQPFRANDDSPMAAAVPAFQPGGWAASGWRSFAASAGFPEARASTTEVVLEMDPALKAAMEERGRVDAVASLVGTTVAEANRRVAQQRREIGEMIDDFGLASVRRAMAGDQSLVDAWTDLIQLCRDFADFLEGGAS